MGLLLELVEVATISTDDSFEVRIGLLVDWFKIFSSTTLDAPFEEGMVES